MYFDRGNPLLNIQLVGKDIYITDEVDSIQIQIPADDKSSLNRIMIRYISKKQRQV